jgi:hypothetical protein
MFGCPVAARGATPGVRTGRDLTPLIKTVRTTGFLTNERRHSLCCRQPLAVDDTGLSSDWGADQEVRLPLWNRRGAVGFLDAGNVFRSVRSMSAQDLRVGAGFGLRIQIPVGLVRLDYGFALHRRLEEPRGRVFISLGQPF